MEKYLSLFKEMDGRFYITIELRLGEGLQNDDEGATMAEFLKARLIALEFIVRPNTYKIKPEEVCFYHGYGGVTFVFVSIGRDDMVPFLLQAIKSFADVVGEDYKTRKTANGDLAITFTLP